MVDEIANVGRFAASVSILAPDSVALASGVALLSSHLPVATARHQKWMEKARKQGIHEEGSPEDH